MKAGGDAPMAHKSKVQSHKFRAAWHTPLSQLVRHFSRFLSPAVFERDWRKAHPRQNLPAYVRPDGMVGRVVQAGAQRAGQPKAEMKIVSPG
jgi:hypothetical protein